MMYFLVKNNDGELITHGYKEGNIGTKHILTEFENYTEYVKACVKFNVEPVKMTPIPGRITAAQGLAQLDNIGKLQQVEAYIEANGDTTMKIFWSRSHYWDRHSATVISLGSLLGIDLDKFFKDAKDIQI